MLWFVCHSCSVSLAEHAINYQRADTGDLPEFMEGWPEETQWTVPETRR